jgi:hypothetical protein
VRVKLGDVLADGFFLVANHWHNVLGVKAAGGGESVTQKRKTGDLVHDLGLG